ncbi:hypothetical protein AK812_SmicGene41941 [Symbiodinium microadriaticum]|uniref:Uncharacterized protein n=1 Tax=Symbiodinium microadriaticum TaxID=2951 RepID=A0A1Q9C4V4_SYMMI|nr:hypothetical protein AK812_SmicGene41941 [Symbiodinium microadriaticum]
MPLTSEVSDQIRAILDRSKSGDFLVKSVQELFGVLRQAGLMSTMTLPPLSVGVHPQNRDGIMLHQKDCHELLDSIAQVGFVASRVEAIGVEVCSESERDYNVKLCTAAAGKLGSMDPDALKILSLSASHTNFALRLVASAAPHESESLSVNGILSLEQVRLRDPVLAQHVVQGLTWQVIAKEVALAHPELLQLVQSSQNATLVKSESELQLLRRVFSLCSRPNPPDFQGVKKMALSSKPPCSETFPALYTFALRYCGGSDGRFLRETEQFVRTSGQTRSLGLGFWQLLAQDYMKGQQQLVHMRHAILKLGLSGGGLTQSNAKKMYSRECSTKILEGDRVLMKLRELVSNAGIDILQDVRFINILGIVDMTVARFCLGIQAAEDGKDYKSIAGIAHDATLLFGTLGVQLTSPWQSSAEAAKGAQSSNSQALERMRELNSDGSLRNASELLADKGFTLQAFVRRRADKLECRIDGIHGQQIHLVELKNKGVMKVPLEQFLAGTWVIFQPRSEPEIIEDLSVFMPSECYDFQAAVVVACIQQELATLTENHKNILSQLSMQLKPTKALVTTEKFKAGQLVLVPSSFKIVQRLKSQGDLPNAVKEHADFARDKFEEDVREGLMAKMTMGEFLERYGERTAIAALAVIVEDEELDKKRIIHDATHGVRVNHRIKCRDKLRSPGAREKKHLLREHEEEGEAAFSVVGDIAKAHRRYKHAAKEHGYLACQANVSSLGPGFPLDLLLYADDLEAMGRGAGAGLSGGMAYPTYKLGLSLKRATWLVEWLRLLARRTGKTEAKAFAQGLGRLGFASIALDWERPFLGPLHAWSSAVHGKPGPLTLPTMVRVLCGWLADRLESGGRLQKPEPLLEGAAPLSFFTDAKAEAGRAWIGGFLELVDGCQGPWFSLEVVDSWAPWAFAKGDPGKVIAALELLATLVGVRLWVPDGDAKKTSRVAIRGYTDNQSNESLLKKAMTTKRDLNQLADDLTNENFASFDPNFRIDLEGEALEWRVLGRLVGYANSYFEELGEAKRTKKVHATRFAKRARKLGPW